MSELRRNPYLPWISAGVAGVVLIALVLVYVLGLAPDKRHADRQRLVARERVGQLTTQESAAMDAAGTEMINLVTFSRASFDADFQRALNGATGGLRQDVVKERAPTLQAMTQGKFDLYGRLTHKALEERDESGGKTSYVVMVTLNGFKSISPSSPTPQNLAVTVVDVHGKWLASDVKYIGVQS